MKRVKWEAYLWFSVVVMNESNASYLPEDPANEHSLSG